MARNDGHWTDVNPALKYCQATAENMQCFYLSDIDYCKLNILTARRSGITLRVEDTLHSTKTFSRALAELNVS